MKSNSLVSLRGTNEAKRMWGSGWSEFLKPYSVSEETKMTIKIKKMRGKDQRGFSILTYSELATITTTNCGHQLAVTELSH